MFNNLALRLNAALAGLGLAYMPEQTNQVQPYVRDGRLIRVLEDWCPPFAGYHLYYPSGPTVPRRSRSSSTHFDFGHNRRSRESYGSTNFSFWARTGRVRRRSDSVSFRGATDAPGRSRLGPATSD